MKKAFIALMALTGMATAGDLYYIGSSGDWWEVGSNWSGGNVPTNSDTVWIGYNTDGSTSLTSTVVKLGNNGGNHKQYGFTVNIAAGSQYNVTSAAADYKPWGSTFNIYGADGLKIEATMWGDYKNGDANIGGHNPLTLNLYNSGSVLVTGAYTSAASAHMALSGSLDADLSVDSGDTITLGKRTLITFTGTVSGDFSVNNSGYFTSTFTTLTGDAMTLNNSLNLNGELTADMVGQYKLTFETMENGDKAIVANYVTAIIPEPTTAMLSLLALAGLSARRRRASR
ncbi:MAG: PEP-CTERM sorting domain-containing protein [Akkermansia sp.]|nr:PEP-CTERM sorting domain-containing protein [Akkermansia sp.]